MCERGSQEFLAECGRAAVRKDAQQVDAQIRMWLKCGYELDELRVLRFVDRFLGEVRPSRKESEVVPASFERL